jgi:ankyrin repeat protein
MGITSQVTGLHIAAYYGVDEIAEALILNDSVDINAGFAPGFSPLSLAAMHNHERIVYKLLEHKSIAFDLLSLIGENKLSMAASNGNFGLVERLLNQRGVEDLEKSHLRADSLALIHATWHGHEDIVRLVLEKAILIPMRQTHMGARGY